MRSHVWHLFRKDGTELLRDRRTLFVNIVLPVLLFPLVMLFLIQVTQLTRAQKVEPPRIALIDAPPALVERLPTGERAHPDVDDERDNPFAGAPARIRIADDVPRAVADELRERVLALDDAARAARERGEREADERLGERSDLDDRERALERDRAGAGAVDHDPFVHARRAPVLALLREHRLAAAVLVRPGEKGGERVVLVKDEAHPEWESAESALAHGLAAWRKRLTIDAVTGAGLSADVLKPVRIAELSLAPPAETLRARFAGVIPLILVVMAVSGAFYPAIDLFAGERERGTLESLLSWPVRRRDIFLGKLSVAIVAAVVSVVLNLLSLGLTTGLAGSQLAPPGAGPGPGGLLTVGFGTLLVCFLALLPLVVTLATVSLALAGYAASAKEAQNYLTPLMLVVFVAAVVAAIPGTRPTLPLDLIPITGPVLALKESLRAAHIPWLHLGLSTATSLALAVVVVGWAVRLLESERFCYPGLVRAGWGIFRKWGPRPEAPGAIEAMGVYAVCVGAFTIGGGAMQNHGWPAFWLVVAPLVLCIAGPALAYTAIGAYPLRTALHLAAPKRVHWQRVIVCVPFAVICSLGLLGMTRPYIPESFSEEAGKQMEDVIGRLTNPLLLTLAVALAPAICEELLCRGLLLSALRRSIGGWGGALLSAFLFAILHLTPYRFLPQFALGVILALFTLRSGSIFPAMALHFSHNALALLLSATVVPGTAFFAVIQPSPALGACMGVCGWLAMLAIVALPEPRVPAATPIAPPAASPTPGTP